MFFLCMYRETVNFSYVCIGKLSVFPMYVKGNSQFFLCMYRETVFFLCMYRETVNFFYVCIGKLYFSYLCLGKLSVFPMYV